MPSKKIHIGTSGWSYPHWMGRFYPKGANSKEQFQFYTKHFDTVEINNSFYRLPARSVFETWYEESPKNFLYVMKANRYITHMKKLNEPRDPLERMFNSMDALQKEKKEVFVYFDNDPNAYAVFNAIKMKEMLGTRN